MPILGDEFSEFVRRRMVKLGLSTYEVARASGGAITHQTVWSLVNAPPKDIKLSTLLALSRGLSIPEDEIFAVARGKTLSEPAAAELQLSIFFKELGSEYQQAVKSKRKVA